MPLSRNEVVDKVAIEFLSNFHAEAMGTGYGEVFANGNTWKVSAQSSTPFTVGQLPVTLPPSM